MSLLPRRTSSRALSLLCSTLLRRKLRIPSIRLVRTSIELLVTAPLQRCTQVHKGIALDRKRTRIVSRVQDRSRSNAAERAGEGLRVGLTRLDGEGAGAGGSDEEGEEGSELHLGGLVCW